MSAFSSSASSAHSTDDSNPAPASFRPTEVIVDPRITNISESNGVLSFTLSNVDGAYANALRRVLMSDIPIAVFRTTPHERNQCNITINTSRYNNEIIKQRLSCIPICIQTVDEDVLKKYQLEVDVNNTTDNIVYVTTDDFKVKNLETDTYLAKSDVENMFPPFLAPNSVRYPIEFLHLSPKLTNSKETERIQLTSRFTVGTAREDGCFNVVCTCTCFPTVDERTVEEQMEKMRQEHKDKGVAPEQAEFAVQNWKHLEARRNVIANSFDFKVQSVGIYDNAPLMVKACEVLHAQIRELDEKLLAEKEIEIQPSQSTMENAYDVELSIGYSIGNMLQSELYNQFCILSPRLDYVGFIKRHPHDTTGLLRMNFINADDGAHTVKELMHQSLRTMSSTLKKIHAVFKQTR